MLIVVGLFEFGAAAVHALVDGHPAPRVGVGGFAIVLATMAVNLLGRALRAPEGDTSSEARCCSADARHTQSDLYASLAVVASFVAVRAGAGLGGRRGDAVARSRSSATPPGRCSARTSPS